jgi:hypothetical protein
MKIVYVKNINGKLFKIPVDKEEDVFQLDEEMETISKIKKDNRRNIENLKKKKENPPINCQFIYKKPSTVYIPENIIIGFTIASK